MACKLLINGIVQGVGFRPTVYKVAVNLHLSGWVKNTSRGVEVVISDSNPESFISNLKRHLPKLASLDSIACEDYSQPLAAEFVILPSVAADVNDTVMPPDSYICEDCFNEIFDPNSRYYLYPFTNCTNCGPRYTVIGGLPYDRKYTALADFPLCPDCEQEYRDPENRRYHAQATACPNCGPQFSADFSYLASQIQAGKIIALKGIGGYVLIADAANSAAITTLRKRKERPAKPFALMALNTSSIQQHFAHVQPSEKELLESAAAPIVLLNRKARSSIAPEIAPRLNTLGFMLANNPIFYILFYYLLGQPSGRDWLNEAHDLALVVTSANFSGGTIISDDAEAMQQLSAIADIVVHHDRQIIMKCDDSLLMVSGGENLLLRRARGIAPKPFYFPYAMPQVIGLGAHLKNTITFTRENKIFTSQYLGDMSSEHTIKYFKQILAHYQQVFNFKPQLVVSDLHPDFFVSNYARELAQPHLQLQHHHAHLASVIGNAESNSQQIDNEVFGCILDGYGYGSNGEAWGGELIKFNRQDLSFTQISQIPELIVPGGDIAEREPWRLGLALCVGYDLPVPEHIQRQAQAGILQKLIISNQFSSSTSMGRVFSAVAGLLGVVDKVSYEAEAAMILESMVRNPEVEFDSVRLTPDGKPDFALLFQRVYQLGIAHGEIGKAINVFYGSLAALLAKWILFHASINGIRQVALSGGCWQSRYLFPLIKEKMTLLGIELLIPKGLPVNDECISFGQAWYGAQTLLQRSYIQTNSSS